MLKTIEISNFQAHKNTYIEFDKGMNVITGSSRAGKSSIIRAILLALRNRPSGGSYKSWFAKDTDNVEVSLEFDDGWFTRTREKDKNKYITDNGVFEALRSDVPEAIQTISNIVDYNIQTQFQPYFLLQDSPGDRAKKLNDLVGLNIIDRIFKKLNSKISLTKQDIGKTTIQITSLEEQLEGMSYLASVEVIIDKLSNAIDKYTIDSGRAVSLAEMIGKLREYDEQKEKQAEIIKAEPLYTRIYSQLEVKAEQQKRYDQLFSDVSNLKVLQDTLKEDTEWLSVEHPYLKIQNTCENIKILKLQIKSLETQIDLLIDLNNHIVEQNQLIDDDALRYVNLFEAAGICPTCERPINSDTIKSMAIKLKED